MHVYHPQMPQKCSLSGHPFAWYKLTMPYEEIQMQIPSPQSPALPMTVVFSECQSTSYPCASGRLCYMSTLLGTVRLIKEYDQQVIEPHSSWLMFRVTFKCLWKLFVLCSVLTFTPLSGMDNNTRKMFLKDAKTKHSPCLCYGRNRQVFHYL